MSKRRRLQAARAAASTLPAPQPPLLARPWVGALVVFVAALLVRVLFWQATPGTEWPHSIFFKGDAVFWLRYALALERHQVFELGLPFRPPATAYLMALVWDGRLETLDWLRVFWLVQGALVPSLAFLVVRRAFGPLVAWLAAAGGVASTALILLSSSLNNETPSLVLVLGTLLLFDRLRDRPRRGPLILWSALHGLACLFRVEHVLFYGPSLLLLAWAWSRAAEPGARRRLGAVLAPAALSAAVVVAMLAPWHVHAWREVRRLNTVVDAAQAVQLEHTFAAVAWDEAARQRASQLPGFVRAPVTTFVAATVVHRGGQRVRAEDLGLLEEAFGYESKPMARFPFVAGYGPLNFALANAPGAQGGFDRSRLSEPPRLLGGPARYPKELLQGLPPEDLALAYPPHLRLYNEGYAIGGRWIRENPRAALALAGRKLALFWQGAALGFTGYNLPLGLSGRRRAVDLVVPEGGWAPTAWRLLLLAGAGAGLAAAWRRAPLHGWLLFLLSKVAATVVFFGYARQGAMVTPVVLLLLALAAEKCLLRGRLAPLAAAPARLGLALLAVAVLVEAARQQAHPQVLIDGEVVTSAADPVPLDVHLDHRIVVR